MKKLSILFAIFFLTQLCVIQAFGGSVKEQSSLTFLDLVGNMPDYEKKNISLEGTILGACTSGCKVWVSHGDYKKGDPVALVWAKDDAFKFKTDATGQKVKLQGYAVGKYVDMCALKDKTKDAPKEAAAEATGKDKKDCEAPAGIQVEKEQEDGKQLKSITFFATSVEYLN
jgi:hypothetical protein